MNFTLRLSAVICVLPVSGILRILPCLWRTSNLPNLGKLQSEAVDFNVLCDLGHDAISDRVDDVVRFAIRAEIQRRTDSRSDRFTSDLRTFCTLRRE